MTTSHRPPVIGVAVDGTGSHPASRLDPTAGSDRLLDGHRLAGIVQRVEQVGATFVTLDDVWSETNADGTVVPRLDAVLSLARVAPLTSRIGLVAVVPVTHTEPFHVSKNIATLDHVSAGRAGWWPTVARSRAEAELVGRKDAAPIGELLAEAADAVEVVRRLWDSWEDDAVIRDLATGRYVDRDRLHRVDFQGAYFSVRGPSITPRPPQGQPVVAVSVRGADDPAIELAARQADVVIVETPSIDLALLAHRSLVGAAAANHRSPDDLRIVVAAEVLLEGDRVEAHRARERLDRDAIHAPTALDLVGTSDDVASFVGEVDRHGFDGVHLRPARLHVDLDRLAPVLAALADDVPAATLRGRLGLERPVNRYRSTVTP